MALNRKVSILKGLGYKGGGPMWAWLLHRVSGLAMVLFVGLHIFAGSFSGEAWNSINLIYTNDFFQLILFFLVIYHAVNGLRVVIMDLFTALLQYQREMIWLQWFIIVPLYGLILFVVFKHTMGL